MKVKRDGSISDLDKMKLRIKLTENEFEMFILVLQTYNSYLTFTKIERINDTRFKNLLARIREYDKVDFRILFMKAKKSDFLNGRSGEKWRANFDFLFSKRGFLKVLEGNYDNIASEKSALQNAILNIYSK